MSTFEQRESQVTEIRNFVSSGAIETACRSTLTKYSTWLCNPAARSSFSGGEYEQICELVRLHMLRTFMEEIEKRNTFMQYLVIVLAVAALIVAIPQIWFAYKADKRAELVERKELTHNMELQSPMSVPNPSQPLAKRPDVSQEYHAKTAPLKP